MYGYAEQNKVPFVVPVAAFPQLTKPGSRYTFRIEPDAAGWGYAIAQFVAKQKPSAKIALVYSDFALMRAIAAGLKYAAPKAGLKIEPEIIFPQGSNDATVQAAQVLAAQPDFVVPIGAGAFDNTLTNQLLDIGIKPEQIIHPFGITTQVKNWGKRSAGSYFGTFFDSNLDELTAEGKSFVEQFRSQNDRPPSYIENYCYVTAHIIREAIDKNPAAADDREKFRDAMSALNTKETTSGIPITFDKNGARKEYMYFMLIEDVDAKGYKAKQKFYIEWDPEVIPVYDIVK
jgi:branched-chain amino acid transport system substrate-binding protein